MPELIHVMLLYNLGLYIKKKAEEGNKLMSMSAAYIFALYIGAIIIYYIRG